MELRSLRYFVAVVEAGSLTRAAGALYVAQPALTVQVKRLEESFGVKLLERSHAGVTPTPAGLQLYQEAVRLLAEADALRSRISKPSGEPEGTVSLAFPVLLVPTLMGQLLMQVRERFPRVRVYVIDDQSLAIQNAVQDGRADFGLLVDPPAVPGLSVRLLATEPIYLSGIDRDGAARALLHEPLAPKPHSRVAQLPLAADPTIRFADAVTLPLVLQSRRFVIRRQAQEAAQRLGLRLNIVYEHDSAAVSRALRSAGAAFSFVPACTLPPRRGDPTQIRARLVEPEFVRRYGLAWLSGRQLTEAARAVMELLGEVVTSAIRQGKWAAEPVAPTGHQFD
jgi:LysR family nitrogen assimilation transcriptional regulator